MRCATLWGRTRGFVDSRVRRASRGERCGPEGGEIREDSHSVVRRSQAQSRGCRREGGRRLGRGILGGGVFQFSKNGFTQRKKKEKNTSSHPCQTVVYMHTVLAARTRLRKHRRAAARTDVLACARAAMSSAAHDRGLLSSSATKLSKRWCGVSSALQRSDKTNEAKGGSRKKKKAGRQGVGKSWGPTRNNSLSLAYRNQRWHVFARMQSRRGQNDCKGR